jgi:hypothetical protein
MYVHLSGRYISPLCHRKDEMLGDVSGLGDVELSFAPVLKDDELLRISDRRAFSRNSLNCIQHTLQLLRSQSHENIELTYEIGFRLES